LRLQIHKVNGDADDRVIDQKVIAGAEALLGSPAKFKKNYSHVIIKKREDNW